MTLEVSTLDARVLKDLEETIVQKVTALFSVEFIIHCQVVCALDSGSNGPGLSSSLYLECVLRQDT